MQSLAQLLAAQGHTIVGSDSDLAKLSALPSLRNFKLAAETAAEPLLSTAMRMIYTDAAPSDHPLRQFALTHNIPQQMLFEATGEFSRQFKTIAVTGTHGKSSTTAFLGHILTECGLDPTIQLGATVSRWPLGNARVGSGDYFVVEADEYRNHFLALNPSHIVITAIDFDHPDFFDSLDDVLIAYERFLKQLKPDGVVVCPEALLEKYPLLPWPVNTIPIKPPARSLSLPLPGDHMQQNAALAVALASQLGIDTKRAEDSLKTFPGLSRRFEKIGVIGKMDVISDYGHHPTEIAATLQAAQQWFPGKKIVAIVETHTAKRVEAFLPLFIEALAPIYADSVIIYPTFYVEGRDDAAEAQASTQALLEALRSSRGDVLDAANQAQLTQILDEKSTQYDIAIGFSAGVLDAHLRQIVD